MALSTTAFYTLSLHDALPISLFFRFHPTCLSISIINLTRFNCHLFTHHIFNDFLIFWRYSLPCLRRSEEHTSELQSRGHLVCRLLLEKKKKTKLNLLKQA